MREIVECEPACSWVTHFIPKYGVIRHALTCPNHPRMLRRKPLPENQPIPLESRLPSTTQIERRRDLVERWWLEERAPRWMAEQLLVSIPTIHDDIRHLRRQGRIGYRRAPRTRGV